MKGKSVFLLVRIVIAFVLALTNPKEEDHFGAAYQLLGVAVGETISEGVGASREAGGILGRLLGGAASEVASALKLSLIEYHNYLLFSTTTFQGRVLTVGILGNVVSV